MPFLHQGFYDLETDAARAVDEGTKKLKLLNKTYNFCDELSFTIEREREQKDKGDAPSWDMIKKHIDSKIDSVLSKLNRPTEEVAEARKNNIHQRQVKVERSHYASTQFQP